jgi:hypothetical protein
MRRYVVRIPATTPDLVNLLTEINLLPLTEVERVVRTPDSAEFRVQFIALPHDADLLAKKYDVTQVR